jgi:uncharacterized membrane protein
MFPIPFLWVFLISFAMILIGMMLMAAASFMQGQGAVSGGALILIGPIPIILGGGPESTWLILLGAAIIVIALFAFLITRRSMYS